jgi:hypothetical protein
MALENGSHVSVTETERACLAIERVANIGRAAISPPSVPSNGISTVRVDTCVTASCFAANRLIARTREASFEANRRFIRIASQWHSDIGSRKVRFTIPLISAG